MRSKKGEGTESLTTNIVKDLLKYVATAVLGALVAFVITVANRLPARALKVSPAGIHILRGPTLTCDESTFISQTLNRFLNNEIPVPACDTLLTKPEVERLLDGLQRARMTWNTDRIRWLTEAKTKVDAIGIAPEKSDLRIHSQVIKAVSDLVYIREQLPTEVSGRELQLWTHNRLVEAITALNAEVAHIDLLATSLKASIPGKERIHVEMFFVVTNSSDVEFFLPTKCTLTTGSGSFPAVLEKLEGPGFPVSALVYVPVLPGRGQLMKFSTADEDSNRFANEVGRSSTKAESQLQCELPDGSKISSTSFNAAKFTVVTGT